MPAFLSSTASREPIPLKIHKVHHRAFAPFPQYIVHPLEWMFGALAIPLGPLYFSNGSISVHAFWAFAFWRNFHEIDIPRSSFVSRNVDSVYGTTEHHDRHHMKKTQGNYASTFTIWDRALKTYIPPTS